jgi:hypothetical protein
MAKIKSGRHSALRRIRRNSALTRTLAGIWHVIFMVIVFGIFTATYLVQAKVIFMPDWTKDLRKYDHDDFVRYSSILVVSVTVMFILTCVTGIAILRAEGY